MELNLKFDEQLLTKVCNEILDEYEYNGKTIREWADRISNPKTNGDNFRAMTDEELAEWLECHCDCASTCMAMKPCCAKSEKDCVQAWKDWLKQECE